MLIAVPWRGNSLIYNYKMYLAVRQWAFIPYYYLSYNFFITVVLNRGDSFDGIDLKNISRHAGIQPRGPAGHTAGMIMIQSPPGAENKGIILVRQFDRLDMRLINEIYTVCPFYGYRRITAGMQLRGGKSIANEFGDLCVSWESRESAPAPT